MWLARIDDFIDVTIWGYWEYNRQKNSNLVVSYSNINKITLQHNRGSKNDKKNICTEDKEISLKKKENFIYFKCNTKWCHKKPII